MERFLCFLWLMMQRFILFSFKMLVGSYFYKHILTWCTRRSLYSVVMWERSAQPCFKNPSEVTLWVIRLSRVIGLGSRWLNIGQVLFFAYSWTSRQSRGQLKCWRGTRPISSHFEWTSLVSEALLFQKENFSLRDQLRKDRSIWPAWVARWGSKSENIICLFLFAHRFSHMLEESIEEMPEIKPQE